MSTSLTICKRKEKEEQSYSQSESLFFQEKKMAPQLLRPLFGGLLAAACGAALADAADDALVFRAITGRAAEAATRSERARDALGGEPLEVSPWWRGAVSAPLRGGRGGRRGAGGGFGSVASASFTVTGPAESGSRAADVVVLAVAAGEEERKESSAREGEEREKEEEEEEKAPPSTSSSSTSSPRPPAPPPPRDLRSLGALLRSLPRRWSPEGWTLVSADITLPRPGGLPGPATGVSLMEEVEKLLSVTPPLPAAAAATAAATEKKSEKNKEKKK